MELKAHWEKVYNSKTDTEVSWFQEIPVTSLHLIEGLKLNLSDAIIDIGGGNSNLIPLLNKKGYHDLTVLDISGMSLSRVQRKMGVACKNINRIESDILEFMPYKKYKLWHDRATFHFITTVDGKKKYRDQLINSLDVNGYFILATFSSIGPNKCSGLDVCQHDIESLSEIFGDSFQLIRDSKEEHITPSGAVQDFIFTVWKFVK